MMEPGNYWVRLWKSGEDVLGKWNGHNWFFATSCSNSAPREVLEPIPTRDELRELREKAVKWEAVLDATNFGLVDGEMVNHIVEHGPKWPRKATP